MPHKLKPETLKYGRHLVQINKSTWGMATCVPGKMASNRTFGSRQAALTAIEIAFAAFKAGKSVKCQEIKRCLDIREPEE